MLPIGERTAAGRIAETQRDNHSPEVVAKKLLDGFKEFVAKLNPFDGDKKGMPTSSNPTENFGGMSGLMPGTTLTPSQKQMLEKFQEAAERRQEILSNIKA